MGQLPVSIGNAQLDESIIMEEESVGGWEGLDRGERGSWHVQDGGRVGMRSLGPMQGTIGRPGSPDLGCVASLILYLLKSRCRSEEPHGVA